MRTMKIIYKIVIILALILICTSINCYAEIVHTDPTMTGGGTLSTADGLPSLNNSGYKPVPNLGTETKGKVDIVLGAITAVGIVVTLIGIALVGFNIITGSASEKAVNQEKYVGIVIAAILIASASTIARIVINFAENAI